MRSNIYPIKTTVWQYPGMGGWHFASVPRDISDEIKKEFGMFKRGWGSLRVMATIGTTRWKTSIFPDKKSGTYLLPVKAEVRHNEHLAVDDTIEILLELLA